VSTRPASPAGGAETAVTRRRAAWPAAFVGFLLLFAGWALATPYDGTPDEMRHVLRAYGVAAGQIAPAPAREGAVPGAYQSVPRSLVRANCFAFRADTSAACAVPPGGDRTVVRVLTPAGRYNPAYYLAIGWPLRLSPDMTGVLLARLLGAALVAALLAWAVAVAATLRRGGVIAGILVGLTPITAHLAGAVNPNGLEIAAGAGLVVGLIAVLLEGARSGRPGSDYWLVLVAGGTLLAVRPAGPVWAVIIATAMLVPTARDRLAALVHDRRAALVAGGLGMIGLLSVGWTLGQRAAGLTSGVLPSHHLSFPAAMRVELLERSPSYATEVVGALAWLDTPVPTALLVIWWLAVAVVVLPAVVAGRPAQRWRLLCLAGLGALVPVVLEAVTVNRDGFVAQGRYFLPVLVGVPILATYVLSDRPHDRIPGLARILAAVLLPAHVLVLSHLIVRYRSGLPGRTVLPALNPFGGGWHPPAGTVTPLLLAAVGAAVLIAYTWRATAPPVNVIGSGRTREGH
jgi:hypothetical protein